MAKASKPLNSQTLLRGLAILESVAQTPRGIPDIAEATGVTYPTVHRIVAALIEARYLRQIDNRTYALGPKIVELGFAAYQQTDVTNIAKPFLTALAQETSDTVHLARREESEVIYLDKLQSRRPVEISSRIGGRKPLISTGVGKAMLLDTVDADLRELYRRDHHLIKAEVSEDEWMSMMRRYRAQGFTYDLGEDEREIRCVSAPLRDASGVIVAAISVSSTVDYMPESRMEALIPVVRHTAAEISRELGFAGA